MALPAFFHAGPTAPTMVGQPAGAVILWFDTGQKILRYWNGTTWIDIGAKAK